MPQNDLLTFVQRACHIDHQQCTTLLNALCRIMSQAGVEQVDVTLAGLGTFSSHKHPEYIQEDPNTGKTTLYPPRISYRMHQEDKDSTPDTLIHQLADQAKVNTELAQDFVKALVNGIFEGLGHGKEVEVRGLGHFRNVISNQGGIQRVAYTPDDQMRQRVNAPFSCFEPVVIDGQPAEVIMAHSKVAEEEKTIDETVDVIPAAIEPSVTDGEPAEKPVEEPAEVPAEETVEVPAEEPVEETVEEPTEEPAAPVVVNVVAEKTVTTVTLENKESANEKKSNEPESQTVIPEAVPRVSNETKRYFTLSALVAVLIACLGWYFSTIERTPVKDTEVAEEPIYAETAADTVDSSSDSILAQQDSLLADVALSSQNTVDGEETQSEVTETQTITKPEAPATKPAEPNAKPTEPTPAASKSTVDPATRRKNPDGSFMTYKLKPGDRLTLVALEYYGDKVFWPYIYEVNRDKLKSPSIVNVGTVLYLPEPSAFGINANDPESVRKAKQAAAKYLK